MSQLISFDERLRNKCKENAKHEWGEVILDQYKKPFSNGWIELYPAKGVDRIGMFDVRASKSPSRL